MQRALAGSAVQGLVNSFGAVVMAAFAAAVKIDTFAYLPVQDFGNAYATFVAQNYGAVICIFAEPLMKIFISAREAEVIACGVGYLRIKLSFLKKTEDFILKIRQCLLLKGLKKHLQEKHRKQDLKQKRICRNI